MWQKAGEIIYLHPMYVYRCAYKPTDLESSLISIHHLYVVIVGVWSSLISSFHWLDGRSIVNIFLLILLQDGFGLF